MEYTFQDQILLGSILGGSSLVKPPRGVNYYLSMRSMNENWLLYKVSEMSSYFKDKKVHLYGKTFRCNSICCDSITKMYSEIYRGGKRRVTMPLLDTLRDIGLAVWYLDNGSRTGREKKNAYINTTKFGKEGTEIIERFFNEVGMACNINKDGNRLKVLFTVKGTNVLFKTIAHRVPEFMLGKL